MAIRNNDEKNINLVEQIIKKRVEEKVDKIYDSIVDDLKKKTEKLLSACHSEIIEDVLSNIKSDNLLREVFENNTRELVIRTFINDKEIK